MVNAPAIVESIGQVPMTLHPNLAAVFRRVESDTSTVGQRFPAVIRDLSTNGAFISGMLLPLLSRVAVKFEVRGIGSVDAVGWVLWQRTADCQLPTERGNQLLPKGFGVLWESIPLETRTAIASYVARQ
ncbi:MAG TPA: PilZ domain-containing protein [Kofleriaceae bacterium]|nr:PilZ domain-containing protein [Kofleriaceae bacterium]